MRPAVSKLGLRLAIALVGALVGLGVGEVLVRLFGPEIQVVFRDQIVSSDDPALGYSLRPGAADGAEAISAAGLRDREYASPKPAGVVRIAAVGDSITFGFGNPRAAGWTKRLEALLAERTRDGAPRIEVINLGVPGYNIEQSVARLAAVGLDFEPDAIVYGYSLNDPQDVSIEAHALETLRAAFEGEVHAGLGRWLASSRLYLLARQIAFERDKRAALQARPPRDPAFDAERTGNRTRYFRTLHQEGESAARLDRGLDALAALARPGALPVLVVVFPLFGNEQGFGDEDGTGPEALADVHQLVADAASQRGFAVLDLLPVYGATTGPLAGRLALDFMHPNPHGHRVAATALLDWMCANAWPPVASIDCHRAASLDATRHIARRSASASR